MNYDEYDCQSTSISKDEAQILLAWLFFFWLLIPYHAVVGLIKMILSAWSEDKQ